MRERAGQMQCMARQFWYMFGAVVVQNWCIRALARPLARVPARTKTLARGLGSLARAWGGHLVLMRTFCTFAVHFSCTIRVMLARPKIRPIWPCVSGWASTSNCKMTLSRLALLEASRTPLGSHLGPFKTAWEDPARLQEGPKRAPNRLCNCTPYLGPLKALLEQS